MIPVEVDVESILRDLNAWGWKDEKIEMICGFSKAYVIKLRSGPRPGRPYQMVARLYNFWEAEQTRMNSTARTVNQTLPRGYLYTTERSD